LRFGIASLKWYQAGKGVKDLSDIRYAGDVSPEEAWALLESEDNSVLVDVRTDAEWNYVGLPDLEKVNKGTVCISWLKFPGNTPNESFVEQVVQAGIRPDQTVLLLCRSGQRSISAAVVLTENGYAKALNVLEGFEGDKDPKGQRGTTGGWKVRGLPWKQN
jgi:rhodanese-related sulfurtransferase